MGAFLLAQIDNSKLQMPNVEYSAIIPELILVSGALVLLLTASLMREKASQTIYAWYTSLVAIAGLGGAYYSWKEIGNPAGNPTASPPDPGAHSAFAGAIANDRFSVFVAVVILVALLISTLVTHDWMRRKRLVGPEVYVLAMIAAAGGMFMGAANDLIVMFLGLEVLSIALYVLAGFNRRSDRSREAALKYLLLGGFSSAVFLYGIALVYGAVGSTNMSNIAEFLSANVLLNNGLLLAGVVLMIVGLAFKVAAVPFHQWTPDVYEGSPTPITGFMAGAAKAAAFAAFVRLFDGTLYTLKLDWQPVILALAILTLVVGSVVACVQTNTKRMLAYSSISHAGYMLLGVHVGTQAGSGATLYYLLAYAFIVGGSFAIVSWIGGKDDDNHGIGAYKGLGKRNPGVALAFSVLLFAQAGVPLTAGFLAKFYVISALVQEGWYWVGVLAMLVAAIAAFFYLRIVVTMWAPQSDVPLEDSPREVMPPATWLAVAIALVFTVGMGVAPPQVIDAVTFARDAVVDLFPAPVSAATPPQ